MTLNFVDIEHMLSSMGVENVASRGDEVQFSCPFPGHAYGDRNPSNSMNKETTAWNCFGCHRAGNAITFVAMFEGISPAKAFHWLNQAYNKSYQSKDAATVLEECIGKSEKTNKIVSNTTITNGPVRTVNWAKVAENIGNAPESLVYMLERKFAPVTLSAYEISYDEISDRIAIPIKNKSGELVGYKARTPYDNVAPRYIVLGDVGGDSTYQFKPCKISLEVFNLHRYSSGDVIICEGELNAIMLTQLGYRAIAISGSNPSDYQLEAIANTFDEVILFLDSDKAGKKCLKKISKELEFNCVVKTVAEHEGDACSLTANECHTLIKQSQSSLQQIANIRQT